MNKRQRKKKLNREKIEKFGEMTIGCGCLGGIRLEGEYRIFPWKMNIKPVPYFPESV